MSIIKNIGNLPPEFRRTERNDKQAQIKGSGDASTRAAAQSDKVTPNKTDQVNLSDSAKILLQRETEVNRFSSEMHKVETLAPEERAEIEEKIESGFYSSPEVTSTVAGKIANETQPAKPGLTPTRIQEVMERIQSNDYDSEKVINIVADQILKDLLK